MAVKKAKDERNARKSVIRGARRLTEAGENLLGVNGELNQNFNQISLQISQSVEQEARKEEESRRSLPFQVDDSFTKCFNKETIESWNFNIYLFPLWFLGMLVRYIILFPLRLVMLVVAFFIFSIIYSITLTTLPKGTFKFRVQRKMVQMMCFIWVASWTAVIRCHGPKPRANKGRVWVCNHTSMIDFLVLSQVTPFATVMQQHPGWIGLLQTYVMDSFGCVQFNRKEAKDRTTVTRKIKDYIQNDGRFPLLIFPEGTCVNNKYSTMFKKGAFELDAVVHPVALKYNKLFVDAFWSSRTQSFAMHLVELMTSWAVVADLYFLEPQYQKEGETSIEFASRVQQLIARKAKLKIVPWDGMLKYYSPSPAICEKKREVFSLTIKDLLHDKKRN